MSTGMHIPAIGPTSIVAVHHFYDEPVLYTCRDETGRLYLTVFADEDEASGVRTWLLAPISPARSKRVRTGKVSLLEAFRTPEGGMCLSVAEDDDGSVVSSAWCPASGIPPDMLPVEDARLEETGDSDQAEVLRASFTGLAQTHENWTNREMQDHLKPDLDSRSEVVAFQFSRVALVEVFARWLKSIGESLTSMSSGNTRAELVAAGAGSAEGVILIRSDRDITPIDSPVSKLIGALGGDYRGRDQAQRNKIAEVADCMIELGGGRLSQARSDSETHSLNPSIDHLRGVALELRSATVEVETKSSEREVEGELVAVNAESGTVRFRPTDGGKKSPTLAHLREVAMARGLVIRAIYAFRLQLEEELPAVGRAKRNRTVLSLRLVQEPLFEE